MAVDPVEPQSTGTPSSPRGPTLCVSSERRTQAGTCGPKDCASASTLAPASSPAPADTGLSGPPWPRAAPPRPSTGPPGSRRVRFQDNPVSAAFSPRTPRVPGAGGASAGSGRGREANPSSNMAVKAGAAKHSPPSSLAGITLRWAPLTPKAKGAPPPGSLHGWNRRGVHEVGVEGAVVEAPGVGGRGDAGAGGEQGSQGCAPGEEGTGGNRPLRSALRNSPAHTAPLGASTAGDPARQERQEGTPQEGEARGPGLTLVPPSSASASAAGKVCVVSASPGRRGHAGPGAVPLLASSPSLQGRTGVRGTRQGCLRDVSPLPTSLPVLGPQPKGRAPVPGPREGRGWQGRCISPGLVRAAHGESVGRTAPNQTAHSLPLGVSKSTSVGRTRAPSSMFRQGMHERQDASWHAGPGGQAQGRPSPMGPEAGHPGPSQRLGKCVGEARSWAGEEGGPGSRRQTQAGPLVIWGGESTGPWSGPLEIGAGVSPGAGERGWGYQDQAQGRSWSGPLEMGSGAQWGLVQPGCSWSGPLDSAGGADAWVHKGRGLGAPGPEGNLSGPLSLCRPATATGASTVSLARGPPRTLSLGAAARVTDPMGEDPTWNWSGPLVGGPDAPGAGLSGGWGEVWGGEAVGGGVPAHTVLRGPAAQAGRAEARTGTGAGAVSGKGREAGAEQGGTSNALVLYSGAPGVGPAAASALPSEESVETRYGNWDEDATSGGKGVAMRTPREGVQGGSRDRAEGAGSSSGTHQDWSLVPWVGAGAGPVAQGVPSGQRLGSGGAPLHPGAGHRPLAGVGRSISANTWSHGVTPGHSALGADWPRARPGGLLQGTAGTGGDQRGPTPGPRPALPAPPFSSALTQPALLAPGPAWTAAPAPQGSRQTSGSQSQARFCAPSPSLGFSVARPRDSEIRERGMRRSVSATQYSHAPALPPQRNPQSYLGPAPLPGAPCTPSPYQPLLALPWHSPGPHPLPSPSKHVPPPGFAPGLPPSRAGGALQGPWPPGSRSMSASRLRRAESDNRHEHRPLSARLRRGPGDLGLPPCALDDAWGRERVDSRLPSAQHSRPGTARSTTAQPVPQGASAAGLSARLPREGPAEAMSNDDDGGCGAGGHTTPAVNAASPWPLRDWAQWASPGWAGNSSAVNVDKKEKGKEGAGGQRDVEGGPSGLLGGRKAMVPFMSLKSVFSLKEYHQQGSSPGAAGHANSSKSRQPQNSGANQGKLFQGDFWRRAGG